MIRFKETPPGGEKPKAKPIKAPPRPPVEELPMAGEEAPKGKPKKKAGFGRKKPMGK